MIITIALTTSVGSKEWLNLQVLLETNKIFITDEAAGVDGTHTHTHTHTRHIHTHTNTHTHTHTRTGVMDMEEFIGFLDETLETHFAKLKAAVLEVRHALHSCSQLRLPSLLSFLILPFCPCTFSSLALPSSYLGASCLLSPLVVLRVGSLFSSPSCPLACVHLSLPVARLHVCLLIFCPLALS
jgi:hypothetical protein